VFNKLLVIPTKFAAKAIPVADKNERATRLGDVPKAARTCAVLGGCEVDGFATEDVNESLLGESSEPLLTLDDVSA
jgi:hypothetical protein